MDALIYMLHYCLSIGAAPINWCIIDGEKYSGNTTMLMDVGLDTEIFFFKAK